MSQATTINEVFSSFRDNMNDEQQTRDEIREIVKELQDTAVEILAVVQGVHQPEGIQTCGDICKKANEMFSKIKEHYTALSLKVPSDQYYRYHDHWRFATQRVTFIAAFLIYLEFERIAVLDEVAEMMGVKSKAAEGFHLDLDDFLMGLLQVANELSRLAVNAVTAGDFGRPIRIAKFVGDLDSGFRLLNLKNDSLRKRYDSLKYSVKKVEEVVYDVSIRGLVPKQQDSSPKQQDST